MYGSPISRRAFLQLGAAGAGCSVLLLGCGRTDRTWQVLTDEEAQLVIAIAEQMVPADEDPGATDAGVVFFIDQQLASHYKRHQPAYRTGLAALQRTCEILHGRSFEALTWDEQTAVLERLERGEAPAEPWTEMTQQGFFSMLRDHSLQGFYGAPQHGGNRLYMSYRMIGLDHPPVLGRRRPSDV